MSYITRAGGILAILFLVSCSRPTIAPLSSSMYDLKDAPSVIRDAAVPSVAIAGVRIDQEHFFIDLWMSHVPPSVSQDIGMMVSSNSHQLEQIELRDEHGTRVQLRPNWPSHRRFAPGTLIQYAKPAYVLMDNDVLIQTVQTKTANRLRAGTYEMRIRSLWSGLPFERADEAWHEFSVP